MTGVCPSLDADAIAFFHAQDYIVGVLVLDGPSDAHPLCSTPRSMKPATPQVSTTKRRLGIGSGPLIAMALFAMEAPGEGQSEHVPSLVELAGDYQYVGNKAKDEAEIRAQVEAATAGMGRFVRKRALPRLEKSTRIPKRLDLATQGRDVVIKMGNYVVRVPKSGAKVNIKTPIGDTAESSFRTKTATLLQDVKKTDSRKLNTFRFDDDGQLVMRVQIQNDKRLATPLDFTLLYARTN